MDTNPCSPVQRRIRRASWKAGFKRDRKFAPIPRLHDSNSWMCGDERKTEINWSKVTERAGVPTELWDQSECINTPVVKFTWIKQDKNSLHFPSENIFRSLNLFLHSGYNGNYPSFILVFLNDRRNISRQTVTSASHTKWKPLTCSHNLLNDSGFRKCCAAGTFHPLCYSAFKFERQKYRAAN